MLMKAPTAGGGRDVIFRLVAETDPASKAVLKAWGDELAKTQKAATTTAQQETKKQADDKVKAAKSTSTEVSKIYQQAEMEDLKFRQKLRADAINAEKKAEQEFATWRQNLRKNSAILEQKENIRLAREAARERQRIESESARAANMDRLASFRRSQAYGRAYGDVIGGIGNIGRGVAFSGLIGQENTQTVLNTILGVEAAGSAYRGGRALIGGLGTLASGGTATGGAALSAGAPFAAAAAAIASMTAAAISFTGFVRDARKYGLGGGSEPGSFNARVGGGMARAGAWYESLFSSRRDLESLESRGWLGGAQGLLLSQFRVQGQEQESARQAQMRADRVSQLQRLGEFQRNTTQTLPQARETLERNFGMFRGMAAGGESGSDVQAAYANVRESMERVKQLSMEAARHQLQGSRDQLSNLKQSAQEAKRIADESERAYQNDILKAATADPEQMVRLREIARKRTSGEGLTRSQLEFASQFEEFKDLSEREAERRAREFGLSDIFAGVRAKAKESAAKSLEVAAEVSKAELTVKQQHEFVLKLEGGEFADEATTKINEALKELEARMEVRMREGLEAFAIRRRP